MSVFASRKTVRVDLEKAADGREQWVELRTQLNAGMRDELAGRLYKAKVDGGASVGELEVDIKVAMSSTVALEYWITDWCVYDEDGHDVLLTPATLKLLDGEVADMLLARTRELTAANAEKKGDSLLAAAST